jgi:hypothetical protein
MTPLIGPQKRAGFELDQVVGRRNVVPDASTFVNVAYLATNTSKSVLIPADAISVNFSATGDFYAKFNVGAASVAIPTGDITDGSAPVLNPGARLIPEGATYILMIASAAAIVSLEFWS